MYVKIDGGWYNLEKFADQHPGGRKILEGVEGRDVTVLYKSLHVTSDEEKVDAIRAKYKVPDEKVPASVRDALFKVPEFDWNTEFRKDLKDMLKNYFNTTYPGVPMREASKATPTRYALLAALFITRMVLWYYHLTTWSLWTVFVWPIAEWIWDANMFHDATHNAVSPNSTLNLIFCYSTFFLTSTSMWFTQHIIAHHPFTNIIGYDPDLGRPDSHEKIKNKRAIWTPKFLMLMWVIMMSIVSYVLNIEAYVYKSYNYIAPAAKPFFGYYAHALGRVYIFFVWGGWAWFVAPTWWHAIIWGTIPTILWSFCFMVSTQLTHLSDNSFKPIYKDWYRYQAETAENFNLKSRWITLFSGSLNFQIEHHLFPTINHCHHPYLQPLVQKLCKKHNVEYKVRETMLGGLPQYYNFMTTSRVAK